MVSRAVPGGQWLLKPRLVGHSAGSWAPTPGLRVPWDCHGLKEAALVQGRRVPTGRIPKAPEEAERPVGP